MKNQAITITNSQQSLTIGDIQKNQDNMSSLYISYSNLSYTLKLSPNQPKKILNNLSGVFTPGLNAILGGSGAGKTSLLNIIAKRIDSNKAVQVEGDIFANNVRYTYDQFQNFANFVMQDDILLATLTIREYLEFAANLKLHTWTQEQKNKQVDNIIQLLMLQKCQNTLIGDEMNKGISGGERKRVCIGIELIGNPKVLFLDEPTSGLDSFTAYKIMKTLKDYAEKGNRTIIFTIHQPSSDIWQLFDRITLLVEGRFIYQGSRKQILPYFSSLGYTCPIHSNPSDYLMCLMQTHDLQLHQKLWDSYQKLHIKDNQISEARQKIDNIYISSQHQIQVSAFYAIKILIKRQLTNIKRNRLLLRARIIQALVMNLFLGLIYYDANNKSDTYEDIIYTCKIIYLLGLGIFFSSMNPQAITFSIEREVFLKEEGSKLYSASAYFIAKILPELFVCSYFGIQITIISYWMVGFEADVGKFFFFMLTYILVSNCGNSIGILASSVFKSAKVGQSFAVVFLLPSILLSGVFKNIADIPEYISWFKYLTPTYYQTNSIVQSQFYGKQLIFNPIEGLSYNFNKWHSLFMLFILYLLFNMIAFILLLSHRKKIQ